MTGRRTRFLLSSVGGLAVIGACTGGVLVAQATGADPAAPTVRAGAASEVTPVPTVGVASSEQAVPGRHRNGTYQAVGNYLTPGGNESIGVTISLSNELVTAVMVQTEAMSPTALQFQQQFRDNVANRVLSRDIGSLSLGRVAGASLTSLGFDDALQRIRAQSDVEVAR